MRGIEIGRRLIGPGHACFIIAEAGVNHQGDPALAKQLIVEAKGAGADCIKFQTFSADRVVTKVALKAAYQLRQTSQAESQHEMLRKLQLRPEDYPDLLAACAKEEIMFLSTPYSDEDVDFLSDLGVQAFKIASALVVELDFLQHVACKGKPVILSTGMATLAEVDEAVRAVRDTGNDQLVLLQCTTDYPAAAAQANLRAMGTLREAFGLPVGYSDHTQSATACVVAVALGAAVIEKHLTLDRTLPGPDHATSADIPQFRQLVATIREAEAVLGSAAKRPAESERTNQIAMRRSIVARRVIPVGTNITRELLTYKRPATGISPRDLPSVVGARARVLIEADRPLEWWMVERHAGCRS